MWDTWPGHEHWDWSGHGGSWDMAFHGIFSFLFMALLVVGLVLLIRLLWRGGRAGGETSAGAPSSALSILEERYARGDIDREEFQQRKQDLA